MTKDANDQIDEAALHASIDEAFRKDPRQLSDEDFKFLLMNMRRARALFIAKKASK